MRPESRRLKVAALARLRWDKIEGRHVLLSPERGLSLNETATHVVQLCDGSRSEAEIVECCVERYGANARAQIETDVGKLLRELLSRGLVVPDGER